MIKETFEREYEARRPLFKIHLEAIEKELKKGLEAISADGSLRIRYTDARVKGMESLYARVVEETVTDENIFKRPDILGLRVVVSNISDIEPVIAAIAQGGRFSFAPSVRDGTSIKDKRWIETSRKDDAGQETGYRGWHIDVLWKDTANDTNIFAEIQVRTVLQDAWATLLHDDVYKNDEVRALFGNSAMKELTLSSDLIYSLDRMAQEVRDATERMPIEGAKARKSEAIRKSMFSLASFQTVPTDIVGYSWVKRHDIYEVAKDKGTYEFHIEGMCLQDESFVHILGGDATTANCDRLTVGYKDQGAQTWAILQKDREYSIEPRNERQLVVRVGEKKPYHHYRVGCEWRNIFEKAVEYVWCPWSVLYAGTRGDYRLTLKPASAFREVPRIFDFALVTDIDALVELYHQGKGTQMKTGRNKYTWAPERPLQFPLCFFEIL